MIRGSRLPVAFCWRYRVFNSDLCFNVLKRSEAVSTSETFFLKRSCRSPVLNTKLPKIFPCGVSLADRKLQLIWSMVVLVKLTVVLKLVLMEIMDRLLL